jgi:hypothetical protein
MLYTIGGGLLGGLLSHLFCKMRGVSYARSGFAPSDGDMMVALGVFVGAGIGFGYGVNALRNGNHLYNSLWKRMWKKD